MNETNLCNLQSNICYFAFPQNGFILSDFCIGFLLLLCHLKCILIQNECNIFKRDSQLASHSNIIMIRTLFTYCVPTNRVFLKPIGQTTPNCAL